MLNYKDFNLSKIEYKYIKKRKENYYVNIPFAFDIETTSTKINDEKFAFMYEWTFGYTDLVTNKNHIYYGRKWSEFFYILNQCKKYFNLDNKHYIKIYVHNLGFEFQFICKYFNWNKIFASEQRKPIYCYTDNGYSFYDSLILSGFSLSKLADNLTHHKIKKLVGELDYSKLRTSKTPLTENELAYCNNDVEIVLDYIQEQIMQYKNIVNIPLTNTSRVRKFVKQNCFYSNGKFNYNKSERYKYMMENLTINNANEYLMLKQAFQGGFTHSNPFRTNEIIENVSSIDFTSSYPYAMLSEKFPMSKGLEVDTSNIHSLNDVFELSKHYCLVFNCKFTKIKNTFMRDSYISTSKCFNSSGIISNNGRLFYADFIETTITNIDFEIICKCYSFDSVSFGTMYAYRSQYLPYSIIKSILELYTNKTTLKGVKGKEVEYLLSKGMLNSVYGMCVTDIIRNEINYTNEWIETKVDINDEISKYNSNEKRFLFYPWGVFVTAYARKNLWNGIFEMKDDYIYSDTDSIKFTNYEKHKQWIDNYNNIIVIEKLKKSMKYQNLDFELTRPKTIEGVVKQIGVFDYEETYKSFKTLGAKRYLVQHNDDTFTITCAGLNKKIGMEYIKNINNNDSKKIFDFFNNEMYIPPLNTGKMCHTYIDEPKAQVITDYLGNSEVVRSLSSIHLEPTDFTLSQTLQFINFINNLKNGYVYIGVTPQIKD